MPRGYPSAISKDELRGKIKELEAHIKRLDRREKSLSDLKKWLAARKLDQFDLQWMYVQMRPKREATAVKSKKPLQPRATKQGDPDGGFVHEGKHYAPKGDPEFRRRILAARKQRDWPARVVGEKVGVSSSIITAWERGRYIPPEAKRAKLVKLLELPANLGATASKANGQG